MVAAVCVLVAGAVVFVSAKASLSSDPSALAKIGLPWGGGSVKSVSVVTGPHSTRVPVKPTGGPVILPARKVAADHSYQVRVVIRRPGWISWLAGKTETLTKTVTTPVARLRSRYVTLGRSGALRLGFKQPVRVISYGAQGHLDRHVLRAPQAEVTLPHRIQAGTTYVSAQVQPWETSSSMAVSWFPAGTKATVVASPAPGTQIKPGTPITLTFSTPVAQALGSHLPVVSPTNQGAWHRVSNHAIVFRPEGLGYGLNQTVGIALPHGVRLYGATQTGSAGTSAWTVPAGSTVRLQQMLAILGYLPLNFHYHGAGPSATPTAQEDAAVNPPKGTFGWRFSNTPAALKSLWKVGASGTMMQGAIMMFEHQHGLTADGIAGPEVWKTLINAMIHHQRNRSGYSLVQVSVSSQRLNLWHDGKTIIASTDVNTGAPGTPTQVGTWPVFEHLPVTTMSGTNPNGSTYSDPDIRWVSYFHHGDALHEFTRSQYGFPQSLGCVEMPPGPASQVYPYTPIGTLVHIT